MAKTNITKGHVPRPGGPGSSARVGQRQREAQHHLERKKPMPYVNHYSAFPHPRPGLGPCHLQNPSGHPPFPVQVMLNGHEYVACQARKAGITFTKEGNCFTTISDAAGLAKIADTLSEHRAIGRLSQVCERWIYSLLLVFCAGFGGGRKERIPLPVLQLSNRIQSEPWFLRSVGTWTQVFQALIDRSRAPIDLQVVKTILGFQTAPWISQAQERVVRMGK